MCDIQLLRFQREELFSFASKLEFYYVSIFFLLLIQHSEECKWAVQIPFWHVRESHSAPTNAEHHSREGTRASWWHITLLPQEMILFYKYVLKQMLKCHVTEKRETLWLFGHSKSIWVLSLSMLPPMWEVFSARGIKFNPLVWSTAESILSSLAFWLELLLLKSSLKALMESLKKFENAHSLGQNTSRGSLLWFWTVQEKA